MFCKPMHHILSTPPPSVFDLPEYSADPLLRVGHAQREEAAALLGDAAAAGYLPIEELELRLEAVWAASTAAELTACTSDLPPQLRDARFARRRADQGRRLRHAALVAHLSSYGAVMALLVAIWLLIGLSAGSWYPWPMWPALGWGIGIAVHLTAQRTV